MLKICRIKNGKRTCRGRKSFNPLKMWGSWIGAVIGLIISLKDLDFLMNPGGPEKPILRWIQSLYQPAEMSSMLNTFGPYLLIIILGFLIGGGIHSLIRRYR